MSYFDMAVKFWEAFRELALNEFPTCLEKFKDNRTWTVFMVEDKENNFLRRTMEKLGVALDMKLEQTKHPYFGNDQTWYAEIEASGKHWTDDLWFTEITIEHENSQSSFMTEIYRLSQIIAGLKVGITYSNEREKKKLLPKIQTFIKYRPIKPDSDDYLIIFGPHSDKFFDQEWEGYHFDKLGQYIKLGGFVLPKV